MIRRDYFWGGLFAGCVGIGVMRCPSGQHILRRMLRRMCFCEAKRITLNLTGNLTGEFNRLLYRRHPFGMEVTFFVDALVSVGTKVIPLRLGEILR
jgi:hypothetical protein